MAAPRYTTRFTFTTSAATTQPTEAERQEVKASLNKLKPLLPAGIDPETDETIIYAAGNLAVAGVANLNDDALSIDDAIRVYQRFANQQVNIEHQRDNIVGFIVKAGLSELGTDRLITEDEARAAGVPFNIAIVIAFWRVANSDLCDFVLRASSPGNPDRDKLSLSFEVGFDDYDVVVLPKGGTDLATASAVIKSDSPQFDRYDRALRVNGGTGAYGKDANRVARILSGNIVPLGAGVVTVPAAAVKGLAVITEDPHRADEAAAGLYKYSSTQVTFRTADAAPLLAYTAAIPEEHIYTNPLDPTLGRETEAHITLCYGITTTDAEVIRAALKDSTPIKLRLGAVSAFEGEGRPYDVLKIDVDSADLTMLHQHIKASTEVVSKWPDYHAHATLAYLKPGVAARYVGDTRFAGKELTFHSVTFSPSEGTRTEIPLTEVYSPTEDMTTASRYIKLSEGWQTKLGELRASALPTGGDPLVNGVDVTLSDGRKLMNVKIFDGATLELEKELSMSGVIITDMTPGVGPQVDSPIIEHPHKANIAPTTSPEQQARDAADQARDREGAMRAYTDAAIAHITALPVSVSLLTDAIVSQAPSPMKLDDLKQAIAKVKTIEDLPAVMANTALFAEEIARLSEEQSAARQTAEQAASAANKTAEEVRAQLVSLQKDHDQMKAEQAASAAAAKYQERMATVDEVFSLEDEVKAEIIPEVKACADDASFEKWLSKAKKVMKEKTKDFIKKKKDADCAASAGTETDEAKAARAAQEALASAKNTPVDPPIHGGPALGGAKTLSEQYAEAFAGGIVIGGQKVSELNKLPVKPSR